jgi:uncharacterized protein YndB with AHSA1/START domain
MTQVKAGKSHPAPAKAVVTTPNDREIHIERIYNATRERLWKAFMEPQLLAQWWGRGNKVDVVTWEPVRGGHWRLVEHSDHGDHGFEGRFREITPVERIVQTFEWDGMPGHPAVQTAMFEDLGDGRTRGRFTILFYTTEERDGMLQSGMEGGMALSHEALDRLLAAMG